MPILKAWRGGAINLQKDKTKVQVPLVASFQSNASTGAQPSHVSSSANSMTNVTQIKPVLAPARLSLPFGSTVQATASSSQPVEFTTPDDSDLTFLDVTPMGTASELKLCEGSDGISGLQFGDASEEKTKSTPNRSMKAPKKLFMSLKHRVNNMRLSGKKAKPRKTFSPCSSEAPMPCDGTDVVDLFSAKLPCGNVACPSENESSWNNMRVVDSSGTAIAASQPYSSQSPSSCCQDKPVPLASSLMGIPNNPDAQSPERNGCFASGKKYAKLDASRSKSSPRSTAELKQSGQTESLCEHGEVDLNGHQETTVNQVSQIVT